MNAKLQETWSMVDGTHGLRRQLLGALTDRDLGFSPGGQNMSLGELVREMGDVERSYVDSLKTFTQDWSNRNREPGIEKSLARLGEWFDQLDQEFKAALDGLTDEEAAKPIERGFPVTPEVQLQIYVQALLIFFGKATIYLRAMSRPLPEDIKQWIW